MSPFLISFFHHERRGARNSIEQHESKSGVSAIGLAKRKVSVIWTNARRKDFLIRWIVDHPWPRGGDASFLVSRTIPRRKWKKNSRRVFSRSDTLPVPDRFEIRGLRKRLQRISLSDVFLSIVHLANEWAIVMQISIRLARRWSNGSGGYRKKEKRAKIYREKSRDLNRDEAPFVEIIPFR